MSLCIFVLGMVLWRGESLWTEVVSCSRGVEDGGFGKSLGGLVRMSEGGFYRRTRPAA